MGAVFCILHRNPPVATDATSEPALARGPRDTTPKMLGIGTGEIMIIVLVLLFAVGPDKMPTFMRTVGKGVREIRRTTRELRHQVGIDEMLRDDAVRDPLGMRSLKREIQKPLASVKAATADIRGEVAAVTAVGAGAGGATNANATPEGERTLSEAEHVAEQPPPGVDVDHLGGDALGGPRGA